MRTTYYKSLDRDLNLFGIKGGWIKVFGLIMLAVFILVVLVGVVFDMGVAIGAFIAGLAFSFFFCLVAQQKVPSRRLVKYPLKFRMNVRAVRRESLYRSLRKDGVN